MDDHDSTRSRVHHEVLETKYDDAGKPLATKKLLVIHDYGDKECPICAKLNFPVFLTVD